MKVTIVGLGVGLAVSVAIAVLLVPSDNKSEDSSAVQPSTPATSSAFAGPSSDLAPLSVDTESPRRVDARRASNLAPTQPDSVAQPADTATFEEKYAGKTTEELTIELAVLRARYDARGQAILKARREAGLVTTMPVVQGETRHFSYPEATREDKHPRPPDQPLRMSIHGTGSSETYELTTVPYGDYPDYDAMGPEVFWLELRLGPQAGAHR